MPTDKNAAADQIDREVSRLSNLQDVAAELRELGGLEAAHAAIEKKIDDANAQLAELATSIAKHQDDDKALMDDLATKRRAADKDAAAVREAADAYSSAKRAEADQLAVNARNEADRILNKARSDADATLTKARTAIANFNSLAGGAA